MRTGSCPHLASYQPLSSTQLADPFSIWAEARRDCPVFYVPDLDVWTVTRYEDVAAILDDAETYANGGTVGGTTVPDKYADRFPDGVWSNAALINRDGENHKRAKRLAQRAFLPRRINQLEAEMSDLAAGLLAPLSAKGDGDLMNEFANPFTIGTITRVLGLPPTDAGLIHQVSEDALVILTPGNAEGSGDAAFTEDQLLRFDRVVQFKDYLRTVIDHKRASPDDGVISALVHAEIDGQRLTGDEVEGMVLEQLIAGNDTAANMIGHAVYYLSKSPELWHSVKSNLELVPRVVDEIVRRHSPSKGLFRRTTKEVVLSGVTIPKGQFLHVLWGSANTDDSQFESPLQVILDRENIESHVGFGRGEHRCLGSLLARLEGKVAISAVFEHLGDVTITEIEPLQYAPALTNVSLMSLNAKFR